MKKIFGALVISGTLLASPAFAQVVPEATSTLPLSGGHATEEQMQTLLSPADFQTYFAVKHQAAVIAPTVADQASLIKQIIALLEQEIALMTN